MIGRDAAGRLSTAASNRAHAFSCRPLANSTLRMAFSWRSGRTVSAAPTWKNTIVGQGPPAKVAISAPIDPSGTYQQSIQWKSDSSRRAHARHRKHYQAARARRAMAPGRSEMRSSHRPGRPAMPNALAVALRPVPHGVHCVTVL